MPGEWAQIQGIRRSRTPVDTVVRRSYGVGQSALTVMQAAVHLAASRRARFGSVDRSERPAVEYAWCGRLGKKAGRPGPTVLAGCPWIHLICVGLNGPSLEQATVATADPIQRTPLYDTHVEQGARMVEFAGWMMPISFAGITEEHIHTRTACSVFDVSHMGRLELTGPDGEAFLNRICTRNLEGAEVGRSYYTHVCRDDGGILDDVIVSRFEEHWGIVCNASNREKIVSWLNKQKTGFDVTLADRTTSTAMLAIQGPKTMSLAQEITQQDFSNLRRYGFTTFDFAMMRIVVYRSGYTGEDGLEVVVPAGAVKMLLPKLFGTKSEPHPVIKPAGLGARDTLRIEAGMPLYGHELSESWDSLTAGQGWCVDLSKDFIGAQALRDLKARGLSRRLVGLELDGRRIARQHYKVFAGDEELGEVTSGTLSPTLGKSIAMGLVASDRAKEGTRVEVDLGRKRAAATIVKLPFYRRPKTG